MRERCKPLFIVNMLMLPTSVAQGRYKTMVGVCLSVCLSVACIDLTRERKGIGSPILAGWKPVTRLEVKRSKIKVTRQCTLWHYYFYVSDLHRELHYEMLAAVCLSVRLSVACLDLTRERKAQEAQNW